MMCINVFGISPLLSRSAIRHFYIELLVDKPRLIIERGLRGSQLIRSQFFRCVVVTLKGAGLLVPHFPLPPSNCQPANQLSSLADSSLATLLTNFVPAATYENLLVGYFESTRELTVKLRNYLYRHKF